MGTTGKTIGTVGGAALGTAVAGPIGTVVGGALGGLAGGMFDSNDQAAPPSYENYNDVHSYINDTKNREDAYGYQIGTRSDQLAGRGLDTTANLRGAADKFAGQAAAGQATANQAMRGSQLVQGNLNAQSNALLASAGNQYSNYGGDRQMALDRLSGVDNFVNNGPGPSAAEAQLRAGQDASMGQSLALARSGRGAGGAASALRQAQFSNAAGNQQMNGQLANLRANETQAYRAQQLQGMGLQQNALAGIAGQDLGAAGQLQQGALGYSGQSLGAGQLALGYGNLGANYGQQGIGAYQGLQNSATAADLGYYGAAQGTALDLYKTGLQNDANALNARQHVTDFNNGAHNSLALGNAQIDQQNNAGYMALLGSLATSAGSGGGGGNGGQSLNTGGYAQPGEFR